MAGVATSFGEPASRWPAPGEFGLATTHPDAAELDAILDRARWAHVAGQLAEAAQGYMGALGVDGRSPVALLGLSLVARQSGQREAALRMAEAALGSARDAGGAALALAHLGHCLAGLRRFAEAEGAFRRVLAGARITSREVAGQEMACEEPAGREEIFRQACWQAHLGLGEVLVALARVREAAEEFRLALETGPETASVHFGLGNALALDEDWCGALQSFARVVKLLPDVPEGHFAVAFCRGKLGDLEGAIAGYRRAVKLRPGFAGAWLNLGVSLVADGRDGLGEACYREVLGMTRADTDSSKQTRISALLNLGHLERGRKRFGEALHRYGEALELHEGTGREAEIQVAFCSWHLEQGQFPQAWRALREAERVGAGDGEVANVQGILLLEEDSASVKCGSGHKTELIEETVEAFLEAERLGHRTAASNRGNALLRLGRVEQALRAHERAVQLNPVHAGARYNLALTQLRAGDFRWGWMNYEARWAFRDVHRQPRRFGVRRWEGEPGGTLLVYAEQGLGDTVQFARYLPAVAERLTAGGSAAGLVVEVQPALVRLVEPMVTGVEGRFCELRARVVGAGQQVEGITAHCPLMSLPALLGTETIPCEIPYLGIGLGDATRKDGRLAVGLAWAGNPRYKADGERSTKLETFLPFLQIAGVRWVTLQKGAEKEIFAVQARLPADCWLEDGCSGDRDLADAAAVVAGLDLVITTDTVIAHLAGAIGKPVWILLPWQADWRWMQERETTPWYRTARLFRQARRHDWPGLIARVGRELESVACAGKMGGVEL